MFLCVLRCSALLRLVSITFQIRKHHGPYVLLAILVSGCQHSVGDVAAPSEAAATRDRPAVVVCQAQLYDWPRVVRTQGSLVGDEHAVIGTKVAGRIKAVYVDLGSSVKSGAPIAALDLLDFELQIQQAEAQLAEACATVGITPDDPIEKLDPAESPTVLVEKALLDEARANLERAKPLIGSKTITLAELQRQIAAERVAKARYESALNGVDESIALIRVRRAALALALQYRDDAVIVAPFDGIVEQRHIAPGTYVPVGAPVITLVRTDPLRFRSGVPERKAMDLGLDQEVRITIDGHSQPLVARISRMSPALDMANRALIIEADLPNPDNQLTTGLFAEADIVVGPGDTALAVPASAVIEFAGVQKLWIVQDSQAREQRIQTGRRNERLVEVLSGLEAGDVVVTDGRQGRAGEVTVAEEKQDEMVLGDVGPIRESQPEITTYK
jgi:RND family efflux transporter MFP subunit